MGEGATFVGRDQIVYNVRANVGLYYFPTAQDFDRFLRTGAGPYKYLSTYQVEDAGIYYGREAAAEGMLDRVRRQGHVVLCGRPGAGKSSLINAGLMPPLLREGWLVLPVRGYGYPTSMLRLALDAEQIQVSLEETADLSALVTATLRAAGDRPLAIFMDQFERFLSAPESERRRFAGEFARFRGVEWGGRVRVVFALRSDFLSEMGSAFQEEVPEILNDAYVLQPMTRAEARRAILEPMVGRGIGYDLDFVDDVLLAHLDDEDRQEDSIYPPHIQILCQTLYEAARE